MPKIEAARLVDPMAISPQIKRLEEERDEAWEAVTDDPEVLDLQAKMDEYEERRLQGLVSPGEEMVYAILDAQLMSTQASFLARAKALGSQTQSANAAFRTFYEALMQAPAVRILGFSVVDVVAGYAFTIVSDDKSSHSVKPLHGRKIRRLDGPGQASGHASQAEPAGQASQAVSKRHRLKEGCWYHTSS